MTVFVVNPVDLDLSGAEQYGDLQIINPRYIYGDDIAEETYTLPDDFIAPMVAVAKEFNIKTDYVLIAGDHLQLMVFAATLAGHGKSDFRMLRFDRKAEGYWIACVSSSQWQHCSPVRNRDALPVR